MLCFFSVFGTDSSVQEDHYCETVHTWIFVDLVIWLQCLERTWWIQTDYFVWNFRCTTKVLRFCGGGIWLQLVIILVIITGFRKSCMAHCYYGTSTNSVHVPSYRISSNLFTSLCKALLIFIYRATPKPSAFMKALSVNTWVEKSF